MFRRLIKIGQQVRDSTSRFGRVNGTLYLIGRVIEKISANRCALLKYYFVAQPIRRIDPKMLVGKTDILIKQVFPNDPLLLLFPRPSFVIKDRYNQGAVCFVATRDEHLVGFIWVILDRFTEDEVRCVYRTLPKRKAAWDFDVYVDPKYRLGRTFIRLWDTVSAFLAEQQYQASISRISAVNLESLRSHARMGAVRLGSATFVRLGNTQLMFSDLRPYFHVSFGLGSLPTINLTAPPSVLQNHE
jgi:hypothetical protein